MHSNAMERNKRHQAISQAATKIAQVVKRHLAAVERSTMYAKGLLVLVGACLAGWAQFMPQPTAGQFQWPALLGSIGVVFALVGGVWSLFVDPSAGDALLEATNAINMASEIHLGAEESEREVLDLREALNWNAELYSTSVILRETTEQMISKSRSGSEIDYQQLLNASSRQLNALLGFGGGEYWTLSIFKYVIEPSAMGRIRVFEYCLFGEEARLVIYQVICTEN